MARHRQNQFSTPRRRGSPAIPERRRQSTLVNPIFDATIQYQPFEQTRISLTGQRVVSATYLQDQVTETTGVSADLNQRLLGKLFLDLNGGYQLVKYVSSVNTSGLQPRG